MVFERWDKKLFDFYPAMLAEWLMRLLHSSLALAKTQVQILLGTMIDELIFSLTEKGDVSVIPWIITNF